MTRQHRRVAPHPHADGRADARAGVDVKITSVEPLVVDIESRNWLFVLVETDEGVSGVGEGSLPGHPLAVAAAVEEYREYVVGEDPARIQHLWQLMYRQPFFRSGAIALSAMSGIEQTFDCPVNVCFGNSAVYVAQLVKDQDKAMV